MPTFENPAVDADEAAAALRGLAHATRSIDDPTEIYSVLGSLSQGLASLEQSLHQLGQFHDGPARKRAWVSGDAHAGRAASYQVAWELHRAAEMVHQVAAGLDRAHEVEATIAYDLRDFPSLANERHRRCRQRAVAVSGWQDGRLHTAVLVSPGRERRRDRRSRKAAARSLLAEDRETPTRSGEGEGRRSSPPSGEPPSCSRGPASPDPRRCGRPDGCGCPAIRTPRPPWPAPTRSSPRAGSAATGSSSGRTSTPAARSSTTRGCSTPAA